MSLTTLRNNDIKSILSRSPMSSHFESIRLSKIVANVLKPIFEELGFGEMATGENIRIKRKKVRIKDKNPYQIDPQEDPFGNFRRVTIVEVLCPTNALIAKLKQTTPRMLSKLQERGFCAVELSMRLVKVKPHKEDSLSGDPVFKLSKNDEASQLAKSFSNRLDQSSPLKQALLDLSEALKSK